MLAGVTSKVFFMICGELSDSRWVTKTMIIMNAAEGEKYSTFVPRLANKQDLNATPGKLITL